jgi:hypothetical protein
LLADGEQGFLQRQPGAHQRGQLAGEQAEVHGVDAPRHRSLPRRWGSRSTTSSTLIGMSRLLAQGAAHLAGVSPSSTPLCWRPPFHAVYSKAPMYS